jgi:23S rRNA (uracil1939-C5)-methyltransferase
MLNEFAERIASNPEVIGVWLHLNDDPGNAIFARDEEGVVRTRPILGKSWIQEELGEISYRIGPGDFFQTNPGMAEVLYRRTLDRLDLSDGVPFLDLYCGVGGLALPAAKRTGWALGVEGLEGAVRSAREAARRNGVSAEFMAGEVLELLPDLNKRFEGQHPVITVNPARRGLEEGVVDGLISLSPRRLGYVSCNPEALARDLVLLREKGMVVEDVELFDMFPNTHHVEALALLRPKTAAVSARRAPRRRAIRR